MPVINAVLSFVLDFAKYLRFVDAYLFFQDRYDMVVNPFDHAGSSHSAASHLSFSSFLFVRLVDTTCMIQCPLPGAYLSLIHI